jgi:hypothetical protein
MLLRATLIAAAIAMAVLAMAGLTPLRVRPRLLLRQHRLPAPQPCRDELYRA